MDLWAPVEGDRSSQLVDKGSSMPYASVCFTNIVPRHSRLTVWLLGVLLLWGAVPVRAAYISPLTGSGNFPASFEVLNRWQDDGTLDVLVLVEVRNTDLLFKEENRGQVARLRLEAQLEPLQGEGISRKRNLRTPSMSAAEAGNPLLNQVFGMVLEDVPYRSGRISIQLFDVQGDRRGILNQRKNRKRRSECSADWFADDSPRPAAGVALGDPLYLFLAPLARWNPSAPQFNQSDGGVLYDYMHPSRRFGIEQDKLQVFLPVWPPDNGVRPPVCEGVVLQIDHKEMVFSVRDTLFFDERGQTALGAGRPVGLFYEMDVNLLPQGSYRLTAAPLGGQGRGLLSGFDVIWSLDSLARHKTRLNAEGHLVFSGNRLAEFQKATRAGKEAMLDEFWDGLNPDPEAPFNEPYLEFQSRMAYVQLFLGGFSDEGPNDPRGEVLMLLGPPDEIQREAMPQNYLDQNDAQIKVFQRMAPDREGFTAKGSAPLDGNTKSPYDRVGGIPMPYSERAEDRINMRVRSASSNFGFELWKYDGNGRPLYPNQFSRSSMGSRFLFVDRTGSGDYYLESSNTLQGEE